MKHALSSACTLKPFCLTWDFFRFQKEAVKINLISEHAASLRHSKGTILCRSQKYACVDLLEAHSASERGQDQSSFLLLNTWNVSKNIQQSMSSAVYMLLLTFQHSCQTGFIKESSDILGNTGVDAIRKDTYFLPGTSAFTSTSFHSRSALYRLLLGFPFNL